MKNIVLIFYLSINSSLAVFSQYTSEPCAKEGTVLKLSGEKLTGKEFSNRFPTNLEQFYSDWNKGVVFLQNGCKVTNESITYNRYLDDLLWHATSHHKIVVVDKNSVQSFNLFKENGEKMVRFEKMKIQVWPSPDSTEHFLEILAEGKISFCVLRGMLYFSNSNELKINDKYYLSVEGEMKRIRLSRHSILKIFSSQKKIIKTIFRKNHLSSRNENDIATFISIYNNTHDK
jgi:hypothetical protein